MSVETIPQSTETTTERGSSQEEQAAEILATPTPLDVLGEALESSDGRGVVVDITSGVRDALEHPPENVNGRDVYTQMLVESNKQLGESPWSRVGSDKQRMHTIIGAYPNPGDLIDVMDRQVTPATDAQEAADFRQMVENLAAGIYGDRYTKYKELRDGASETTTDGQDENESTTETSTEQTTEQDFDNPSDPEQEITEREAKAEDILRSSQQLRMGIRSNASDLQYQAALSMAHTKNALSTPKNMMLGWRHQRAKDRYERRAAKQDSSNFRIINAIHARRAEKAYGKYQQRKNKHESHNAMMTGRINRVESAKESRERSIQETKDMLSKKRIVAESRRLERRLAKKEAARDRHVMRAERIKVRGSDLSHQEREKRVQARLEQHHKRVAGERQAARKSLEAHAIANIKSRNNGGARLWHY